MMVFFATVFCFAGYQAVSGRYELARPLLLAGMAMFLTCILGGHFFREWSLHAGSELFDGLSLADMPGRTKGYSKNAVFFWKVRAAELRTPCPPHLQQNRQILPPSLLSSLHPSFSTLPDTEHPPPHTTLTPPLSFQDGAVDPTRQGEYKLCKDKLPVVGTCVYDYFCVAPIRAKGDDSTAIKAWAGILSHVECQDR